MDVLICISLALGLTAKRPALEKKKQIHVQLTLSYENDYKRPLHFYSITSMNTERDVVFVDPLPEELRCPFHRGVFKDPHVSSCGHTFCKACLHLDSDDVDEMGNCPICMTALVRPFYPNYALVAIISHLRVYCKYRKDEGIGCSAIVTMGELTIHEESCEFASKEPESPRAPYQGKYVSKNNV